MKTLPPLIVSVLLCPAAFAQVVPPSAIQVAPILLLTDLGSGQVLFAQNAEQSFQPASVTKVMTALIAFDLIAAGRLKPEQKFSISKSAFSQWNGKGTSMWLRPGEQVTVDRLLMGITTISANDGCVVLAEGALGSTAAWVAEMNRTAQRLGMKDSHFTTPNGWPDQGATLVSARDLVILGKALLTRHPALYRRYFGNTSMQWHGHIENSHDPVTGVIAGADGIKTGHTFAAGYNFLGSAERNGQRLLMVVAGAKSESGRAAASRALLEWGFAAWDRMPLFKAGAKVATIRIKDGELRRVGLIAPRAIYATVPKNGKPKVNLTLHYSKHLFAPIAQGAPLAELEIVIAGQGATRVPLVAEKSIAKAGMIDRVLNRLADLWPW